MLQIRPGRSSKQQKKQKPGNLSLYAEPFTMNKRKLQQEVTQNCVDVMYEEFFKVIEGFLLASRRDG